MRAWRLLPIGGIKVDVKEGNIMRSGICDPLYMNSKT